MENQVGPNPEIGFSSISDLKQGFRQSKFSPFEVTEELISRIIELDDSSNGLNSVLAINSNLEVENLRQDLPLSGIPLLIKDNVEAIGLPATAGSLALAGREVVKDADLVVSLKGSGSLILGSTNLSEWANIRSSKSTSGWSAIGGLTANPWNYAHSAGGSSSGSGAAVAAGLVPAAIGTETDGSIVCPASLNGVVGIKPTVGSVSTNGIVPISFSQDSPGPIARNVSDALLVLEALTSRSDLVDGAKNFGKLNVGVIRQWLTTDTQTNDLFEYQVSQLSKSGINLIEISLPEMGDQEGQDEFTVLMHELVFSMDKYLGNRSGQGVQSLAQVVEFNQKHQEIELGHFGQEYFEIAIKSGGLNDEYHLARTRNIEWARNKVLEPALEKADVLIGVPYGPAWKSDLVNGDDYSSASWMTHPASIAGYPIASIPMGFVDGLPVGLGVVAGANSELTLARALGAFESVFELANLVPTFKH